MCNYSFKKFFLLYKLLVVFFYIPFAFFSYIFPFEFIKAKDVCQNGMKTGNQYVSALGAPDMGKINSVL